MTSPFHRGETRVQRALGVDPAIEGWARKVVRPYLTEEHQRFYAQLPFVVLAARDASSRPWATLLCGSPGFAHAPAPEALVLGSELLPGDALEGAIVEGVDLGLLGIELASRRRNRLNGRARVGEGGQLSLAVEQAFGNCPQHIHARSWQPASPTPAPPRVSSTLSPWAQGLIKEADTLFIASGYRGEGEHPSFGLDASHRGGAPGFVELVDERRLVMPDYAGNNHYNTVGNLVEDPRAGFLFIDFEAGSLLQLTGRVTLDDQAEAVEAFAGAQRLFRFELDEAVERRGVLPMRLEKAGARRRYRVTEKLRQSSGVVSLRLSPLGRELPSFSPGQHLPLYVPVDSDTPPLLRTYSLSGPLGSEGLRLSVKREPKGRVSRWIHDQLQPGQELYAEDPAGDFVLREGDHPTVLLSAGVGITPLIPMAYHLAENTAHPIAFVHGARDGAHYPHKAELEALARAHPGRLRLVTAYSRPRPEDLRDGGPARIHSRRLDAHALGQLHRDGLLSLDDAHIYLCGPGSFMAEALSWLEAQGVSEDRLHRESF